MSNEKTLLKGGTVLTLDPDVGNYYKECVAIHLPIEKDGLLRRLRHEWRCLLAMTVIMFF